VQTPQTQTFSFALRRLLGSLLNHFDDVMVTDVFINGDSGLWVDRGHGAQKIDGWMLEPDKLRQLAVSLISAGGRHLDELNPCVDVRLEHGIRVHAVLPPISTTGALISIRIPRAQNASFDELVLSGLCDTEVASILRGLVTDRKNLLITGPTGSGKTTLLAALMALAPEHERIITIEDVAELQIQHPHVVSLETRQASIEGGGSITLERLMREALRMRPERLVIGECRGPELRVLLGALNTGHDGGAGTLHASSLRDIPARLEALGASAGIEPVNLARQVVSAIDAVVHLQYRHGQRRVAHIGRLQVGDDERLQVRSFGVSAAGENTAGESAAQ
jgi:pilus assembly protein CpaF